MDSKQIKDSFVKNTLLKDTVDVEKVLVLEETLEVDGVPKYAGLKVAPKLVISPMSKDDIIAIYGKTGVPIRYYNHLKRLSDYRASQRRGYQEDKFVSVNQYNEHMELDYGKTEKIKEKLKENGKDIIPTTKF